MPPAWRSARWIASTPTLHPTDQYFIDPNAGIDCGVCVDPCPVDAIYPEDEVPEEWRGFIQINTDYFKK